MFVCCECCVLSGRGLCDELITRLEESYRLWCVVVCDLETSWIRRPLPTGHCRANNEQNPLLWCLRSFEHLCVHNAMWRSAMCSEVLNELTVNIIPFTGVWYFLVWQKVQTFREESAPSSTLNWQEHFVPVHSTTLSHTPADSSAHLLSPKSVVTGDRGWFVFPSSCAVVCELPLRFQIDSYLCAALLGLLCMQIN